MEVETEDQSIAFVGDHFVALVDQTELNGINTQNITLADKVDHGFVEIGKVVELECLIVAKAPLAR